MGPSSPVYRQKPHPLLALFGRRKVVIGMVHLLPLPGAPAYDGQAIDAITDHAVAEAGRLGAGGVDGLIVENHGDIPFAQPSQLGPETAACMAVIADRVRRESGLPIGINVLANAAHQSFAVAKAAGAGFIRVNQWANAYVANEGLLDGLAGSAARYRAALRAQSVLVFADVHVKHGAHAITGDRSIPELARDVEFFDADVAVATGQRTGDSAARSEIEAIGQGCSLPVVVGSGVTAANVGEIFQVADGVIVASSLKHDGVWWNTIDPARLTAFMAAVAQAR